jgi:hypothetical protein
VIVGLQTTFTPEGALDDERVRVQRAQIDGARERMLSALAGTKHRVVNTFETVPSVALDLDAEALATLERSGLAAPACPAPTRRPRPSTSYRQANRR